MRHFCTYFDRNYLLHGLTLYRSLRRHAGSFRLHVLCFDAETYSLLSRMGQEDLQPIALEDFEKGDDALVEAKRKRSPVEYFFTCSPSLPLYVLNHVEGIDAVTYLDSDLFFFSSPQPAYDELGGDSVLIIGHRFHESDRDKEKFGIYNVGFLVFRNDPAGRECLTWWRERCIEWCHDIVEPARFADQKYLDSWPERFSNVTVLQHPGANLARWNCKSHDLRIEDGRVRVDGQPLIFYHFNSFRVISRRIYDVDLVDYGLWESMPPEVLRSLYGTYVDEFRKSWAEVQQLAPELRFGLARGRGGPAGWTSVLRRLMRRRLMFAVGSRVVY